MNFVVYTALLLAAQQATSTPSADSKKPPKPCSSEGHTQFDFWVGEWDVYPNGKDKSVAQSRIEKLYNGCAIRENWMPESGQSGGSLNSFDPETGRWHQTWIGSAPGRVEFEGGAKDGKMVLTGFWKNAGGPGKHSLVRMTYSLQDDGAVRQHGEYSADHGLTWTTGFDFLYRKRD